MNYSLILYSIGFLLVALAGAMIPPAILDWVYGDVNWLVFAKACPLTIIIGLLLLFACKPIYKIDLTLKDTFLLTCLAWMSVAFFAALPFILSHQSVTLTNSFFEALSGLTTTGASIMPGIDYASRGIILWRALLQWLGGVGILVMAMVIMPILRVGGLQLFRNDFSDRSEKIYPKMSQVAHSILTVYSGLTVVCSLCLWLAGMPPFESICYGLSTLSTGGFSTSFDSINAFHDSFVSLILMVFMTLGAMTLVLFVKILRGDWKAFFHDIQIQAFVGVIIIAGLLLSFYLITQGHLWHDAFYHGFFHVISIITTTGYTLSTSLFWEPFCCVLFLILTQIGGCTGSTSGSVKIFRYIILFKIARLQITQMQRPHGIFIPRFQNKPIGDGIFFSVMTYFALYLFSMTLTVLGLCLCDLDLITALSGAVGALNNTGIALGPVMGVDGSYNNISDTAKWILMAAMLMGRLEYVTFFILLSRSFWRS